MSAYFESLNRRTVPSSAAGKPAPSAPPATRVVRPVERPAVPPVVVTSGPSAAVTAAHYTALRERLLASANGRPLRVIVLAGCEGGEGTGQIARDFAETLATSGLKAMLLDAGVGHDGSAAGNDVVQLVARESTASAISVGKGQLAIVAGPSGLVDKENFYRSAEFASWLDRQRGFYDYVLIEAPPLVRFSDGALLGRLCDGVVIVVEAGATHRDALVRGRELLERSDVKVIGAVLTRVRQELPAILRPFFPDE